MSKVKNSILILCFMVSWLGQAQDTKFLSGRIIDKSTKEPLPFATVNLKGTSIGTVSNADGNFGFRAPVSSESILQCSFIGYEVYELPTSQIGRKAIVIELTPSFIELQELVIRPLSPEELIQRAVRKIPENYATTAFETKAYYREKLVENQQPIAYNEGFFKSYYPDYQSDSSQHELLLYRTADKLYDIGFMEKKRLKKEAKARKKADKKGETYEEDFDRSEIQSSLGGPEGVIEEDPVLTLETFLDSTEFKKYKYEYAGATNYLGREMVVISFETKGKIEHMKQEGKIYLDHDTDAIAAVEYTGKFVIPVWARPLLFSFGLAVHQPVFERRVRYQYQDTKWYPETFYALANVGLTKRYVFSSNERSDFLFEQVFTINEIQTQHATPIPKDRQFDADKEMAPQVHEENALDWEQINTLPPEQLAANTEEN